MKSKFLLKRRRPSRSVILKHFDCSVCLQKKQKRTQATLPCSHGFCKGCIDKWRKRDTSCPLCRKVFSSYRHRDKTVNVQQRSQEREEGLFDIIVNATTEFLESKRFRQSLRNDLLASKPGTSLLIVCIYRSLNILGDDENKDEFSNTDLASATSDVEDLMKLIESRAQTRAVS